jgi:hypothetical protein
VSEIPKLVLFSFHPALLHQYLLARCHWYAVTLSYIIMGLIEIWSLLFSVPLRVVADPEGRWFQWFTTVGCAENPRGGHSIVAICVPLFCLISLNSVLYGFYVSLNTGYFFRDSFITHLNRLSLFCEEKRWNWMNWE